MLYFLILALVSYLYYRMEKPIPGIDFSDSTAPIMANKTYVPTSLNPMKDNIGIRGNQSILAPPPPNPSQSRLFNSRMITPEYNLAWSQLAVATSSGTPWWSLDPTMLSNLNSFPNGKYHTTYPNQLKLLQKSNKSSAR
jgi:hypothetical protein